MKKINQTFLAASAGILLLSGCATEPGKKTAVGAGVGALVGAGVGAIIGNQSGERDKGAISRRPFRCRYWGCSWKCKGSEGKEGGGSKATKKLKGANFLFERRAYIFGSPFFSL